MAERPRRPRAATRSRVVALGLSVAALVGIVAGLVATAKPQPAAVRPPAAQTDADDGAGPVAAEPPGSPFADRPAITQTGAS